MTDLRTVDHEFAQAWTSPIIWSDMMDIKLNMEAQSPTLQY